MLAHLTHFLWGGRKINENIEDPLEITIIT